MRNSANHRGQACLRFVRYRSKFGKWVFLPLVFTLLRADASSDQDGSAAASANRPVAKANAGSAPTDGAAAPKGGRTQQAPTLEMNPDAKWVCEQSTVVAQPVWSGVGRVEFPFKIRNGGTAPLQIKAKGG